MREDLNKRAPRMMAVLNPLRVVIDNYPEGQTEEVEAVNNPEDAAGAGNLLNTGGIEDNEMSQGVQHGLHAGANAFVEFGKHESAIGRFHATLDERLACSR